MRRVLTIACSLALFTRIVTAAEDNQFYVVKLCFTGDKSVLRVLDSKQYKKLTARMNAGGESSAFASGTAENQYVPKWMILRGTFPTREAAEGMLGEKKVDPGIEAEKKARAEKVLLLESLKEKHEPAEYNKEEADKSRKELERIRNSLKTETRIPVKHYLGDPLTDQLVDINKPIMDVNSKLITTDIHKLDKVKVDRKGNAVTVKNGNTKKK